MASNASTYLTKEQLLKLLQNFRAIELLCKEKNIDNAILPNFCIQMGINLMINAKGKSRRHVSNIYDMARNWLILGKKIQIILF